MSTAASSPTWRIAKHPPAPVPASMARPNAPEPREVGRIELAQYEPPPSPPVMVKHRFGVRELEALDALGFLPSRVELVDGEIIEMPPIGNDHSIGRGRLHEALAAIWRSPRFIRSQETHRFADGWCPEPDLALLEEEPVSCALIDAMPRLVIEIAESTLDYDLGEKRLRYALAGVPEYWVVNLVDRQIHQFRSPDVNASTAQLAWRDSAVFAVGQTLSPLCMGDLSIDVAAVLPAAGAER